VAGGARNSAQGVAAGRGLWDHPEGVSGDHHAGVTYGPDRDQSLGYLNRGQTGRLRNSVVYVHELAVGRAFPFLVRSAFLALVLLVGARGRWDFKRAAHGDRDGRHRACAGGFYDGLLGVLEEPPDGFAVGFVAQLSGELEDPGGAGGGYSDPAATAFDFGVAVLGGGAPGRFERKVHRWRRRNRRVWVRVRVGIRWLVFERQDLEVLGKSIEVSAWG